MKLITEQVEKVKVITEENNGKKTFYITGPFLQCERVNKNNRLYERRIMEREVKRYNENYISKNRALGELCHPVNPAINLDRVSHMIVSLEQDGNNFIGKAKLLETPMGKIAQNLLNAGVTLGVSSRGVGSLLPSPKGYNVVGEDFMLATAADIVHDPSAPDAFVSGIMEGVEWIYDASRNDWLIERTKRKVNSLVESREYQEKKLELFNEFLNSL
jgi:hypothetical protein